MIKDEAIEQLTDLICNMMIDFQSRTPANPITRDDVKGYTTKMFTLAEGIDAEEEDDFEEPTSKTGHVLVFKNVACASTWT